MTRPAGTTPHGLPYPGSVDIHARTPAALQALAEAVEAKLTALTPGVIIDKFRGVVPVAAFGGSYGTFTVPFPNLAAVTGWIGCLGIDDGGGLVDGFLLGGAGGGHGTIVTAPWIKVKPPGSITVHAIGWGPPR
jgi:hypothetical protein